MGANIMEASHGIRQRLIGKVQEEFNRAYPFLKIEFGKINDTPLSSLDGGGLHTDENIREGARNLLEKDIHMADDMKVSELEAALQRLFGSPVQVYRRSGNFWMETRMSRGWTLKQHNDHGHDITSGF